jgi:hypothetical protein
MLIGAVLGALTTVAVITRRREGALDEVAPDEVAPDETPSNEATPNEDTAPPDEPTAPPDEPTEQPIANPAAGEGDPSVPSPQA